MKHGVSNLSLEISDGRVTKFNVDGVPMLHCRQFCVSGKHGDIGISLDFGVFTNDMELVMTGDQLAWRKIKTEDTLVNKLNEFAKRNGYCPGVDPE